LKIIFIVLGIGLALLVLSFSVVNAHLVPLDYFIGKTEAPLALLLAITLAVGALVGVFAMLKTIMSLRLEIGKLRKTVKLSEKEIANLRSLPIKD